MRSFQILHKKTRGVPNSRKNSAFGTGTPCPECTSNLSIVSDCRHTQEGTRRRRVCNNGHRYTTYETAPMPWSSYEI